MVSSNAALSAQKARAASAAYYDYRRGVRSAVGNFAATESKRGYHCAAAVLVVADSHP